MIPPPPKKKWTIVVKRAVKKSIAADNVPPKVITYEEGQDPEYHILLKGVSNVTSVSTQDDTGGLQVLELAMETEKAAALAA